MYYQFEGYEEIHEAEEWCFEDSVQATRWKLSIPYWTDIKILKDYAPPQPHPDLAAYISNVCDSTKPTVVPKATRKRKAKPKATKLPNVQLVLDNTNPIDIVPQVLRDRMDRPSHPLSNGVSERDDV